jgi:hypothetical protein
MPSRKKTPTLKADGTPSTNVDQEKFEIVREILLSTLPKEGDGLTIREMEAEVAPLVSKKLFPKGVMWWVMTVKLDMEGRGELQRIPGSKPLRHLRTN